MKIYADIGHPAHVHFLRNFIFAMQKKGHVFIITTREKDIASDLLKAYGINAILRGKGAKSRIGRILYVLLFFLNHYKTIKGFNPDICVSISSPYCVAISWFLRKPSIVFEDTESASGFFWIYKCFASAILTTSCFKKELGAKQIRINSYKEFAYLHKNYFHPSLKVSEDNPQKKVIFRFVSHNVNHDKRGDGLTPGMKAALINRISGMANVYVSTEKGLTQQFPDLELQITPENMHHLMASFQLLIGESATMAAEAAVIGIPSIFFDNHGRGYTDELEEKYHLINNFPVSESSIENAIIRATEILNKTNYMKDHRGHKRLLSDKIDVTAFLIWFVENFPKSMDMMKQHPEYQNRFR